MAIREDFFVIGVFSIGREAIIQAYAMRASQVFLAAARRAMRRIPRAIAAAIAVGHADLGVRAGVLAQRGGVALCLARPIAAGVVDNIRESTAIGGRAGQGFVAVGFGVFLHIGPFPIARIRAVSEAGHDPALLGEVADFGDVVAHARKVERIAMQMREIACNHLAFGIVPGARADAVASVDSGLPPARLGAEIGMPGLAAGAHGGGELLAMGIRSSHAAEIGAVTHSDAGHKKAHGLPRSGILLGVSEK